MHVWHLAFDVGLDKFHISRNMNIYVCILYYIIFDNIKGNKSTLAMKMQQYVEK